MSCFGVIASLFFTLGFVYFVPQEIVVSNPTHEDLYKSYSAEEMDNHQRKMQAKLDAWTEARKKETFVDRLNQFKRQSTIISWIPWLLVGWISRKLSIADFLVLLSVPLLIGFLGGVWLGELPVFAGAILVGFLVRKNWTNKNKNLPDSNSPPDSQQKQSQ
jgi:hypothetical protein